MLAPLFLFVVVGIVAIAIGFSSSTGSTGQGLAEIAIPGVVIGAIILFIFILAMASVG